ncbi:MAG: sarcosine oxidase subunit gamma [Sedimentitalea sp.]
MADLMSRPAYDGASLPITLGTCRLSQDECGALTSIAPFNGQKAALSDALKAAHGMAFPAPNRATGKDGARAIWFQRGMAMLVGPRPDPSLTDHAAVTDQSDAWCVLRLSGDTEAVLARLVPIDLRAQHFKRGHTARTQLMHMTTSITRLGPDTVQIMVFRSMATTLVHDLKTAMEAVAARG